MYVRYAEFDTKRLTELSVNLLVMLRDKEGTYAHLDRGELVMKGMYATEELKNRGEKNTVQDLIAEIGEKEGLFLDAVQNL